MKKGILLFFILLVFVACANQHHEDSIVWRKGQSGLAGDSSTETPDGPMIEQNGVFVELGPTGLSEETILIQLSENSTPSQWSPETHTMKKYLGNDVTSTVGFGQLKNDINKQGENIYAISLPSLLQNNSKEMWLHITVGTNIGGVFKEGVLIDFFGNEWTVTNLTFTFFRKNKGTNQYDIPQPIKIDFQSNTASGQISAVKNGTSTTHPITDGAVGYPRLNMQLELRVEAKVENNGYPRTLTLERLCGGKFQNVQEVTFYNLFRGY